MRSDGLFAILPFGTATSVSAEEKIWVLTSDNLGNYLNKSTYYTNPFKYTKEIKKTCTIFLFGYPLWITKLIRSFSYK